MHHCLLGRAARDSHSQQESAASRSAQHRPHTGGITLTRSHTSPIINFDNLNRTRLRRWAHTAAGWQDNGGAVASRPPPAHPHPPIHPSPPIHIFGPAGSGWVNVKEKSSHTYCRVTRRLPHCASTRQSPAPPPAPHTSHSGSHLRCCVCTQQIKLGLQRSPSVSKVRCCRLSHVTRP